MAKGREHKTSEILSKTLSSINRVLTLKLPFLLFLSKILRENREDRERKEKRKSLRGKEKARKQNRSLELESGRAMRRRSKDGFETLASPR